MILYFFLFYFLVGFIEYFRLSEDFKQKMQEDFPYHQEWYLDLCVLAVSLAFGPMLLIMKIFITIKNYLKFLWIRITFPFRLYKFRKKLNKMEEEPNDMKKAKMLFDAMKEIFE